MTISPTRLAALILLAGFALSLYWYLPTYSADLMATWLAGSFLKMGRPDQVYPAVTEYFLMYPPSEWRSYMLETYNYSGPIYPFLYPPLWAKIAAWMSMADFWRITVVAILINSALQMATVWLAWRATRTSLHPGLFMGLAVVFLLGTHIGTISLQQNQPQIFVSCLLVLAVERSRARAPVSAGLALAIAASIKLYPAIFALFWLFGRERRAFASFAVFGAALGLTSILWAGWPLHQAFLEQVRLISNSVLVTGITVNVDAAVAQIFFGDSLARVPALEPPTAVNPDPGWYSMARPEAWRMISGFVLLSAIAALTYAFSRADRNTRASVLWPLALTAVALLSPITWAYYYLPTACFAPVLIEKLGPRLGGVILFATFAPIFGPVFRLYRITKDWPGWPPYLYQIVSVACLTLLTLGFAIALVRALNPGETPAKPERGLAPD